jgi:triosephosphate isomerase (TIM)
MARPRLIVGNWKMHGRIADLPGYAGRLESRLALQPPRGAVIIVCPPFPFLAAAVAAFAGGPVRIGAQDCHTEATGAHTGDVAAAMIAEIGCRAVILGHSERRADHGETDSLVAAKTRAATAAGLTAIVCVGETAAERAAGQAETVVSRQIDGSVPQDASAESLVVAYEPIWAIGAGIAPSEQDIAAMHARIRAELTKRLSTGAAVRLLYGGSVKPGNAAAILATPGVDGVLVGGASLAADDFAAIAASCP